MTTQPKKKAPAKKAAAKKTSKKAPAEKVDKAVTIKINVDDLNTGQALAFERRAGMPFNLAAGLLEKAERDDTGLPMSMVIALIELGWTQEGREFEEDELYTVQLSELDLDMEGND